MRDEKIGDINGGFAKLFKLGSILGPIVTTALLTGIGWIISKTSTIENEIGAVNLKIAVMEGNRFTSADGVRVWDAIGKVREEAAAGNGTVPKWLTDRVDRIEQNLDKLAAQTLELSKSVNAIHKQ